MRVRTRVRPHVQAAARAHLQSLRPRAPHCSHVGLVSVASRRRPAGAASPNPHRARWRYRVASDANRAGAGSDWCWGASGLATRRPPSRHVAHFRSRGAFMSVARVQYFGPTVTYMFCSAHFIDLFDEQLMRTLVLHAPCCE